MPTALTESAMALSRDVSEFARCHIAPLSGLHLESRFPMDLWKTMGREGLLGLSVSQAYGGKGCSALELSLCLQSLVRDGHNLGMALSFLIHQIVARYVIETWADDRQKKACLPDLAKGTLTASMALSEPKKGAHPKYITSTAEKRGGTYILKGEKSYMTNGPIADLFVVIVKSRVETDRNRFSAFLVPKSTPGLEILPPLDIPFFKPAPHGSIRFDHIEIPEESLLGPEDSAYENMALPMRKVEDALMMGAVTGALDKQAQLLAQAFKTHKGPFDEYIKMELGKLKFMLDTAKILSYEAASMIDSGTDHPDQIPLTLFFRNLAREYHIQLEIIMKNAKIKKTGLLETLTNDLAASSAIGIQLAKIRQIKIGNGFFQPDEAP